MTAQSSGSRSGSSADGFDHGRVLDAVLRSLRHLFKVGEGKGYNGLFPSFIALDRPWMLYGIPQCVGGQRDIERCPFGTNLIHEQTTLRTAYELSELLGEKDLAAGADAYLSHFARYCTNTPTGLFPWGEHAFWDIVHHRPAGCNEHVPWLQDRYIAYDHHIQAPAWLWDKLWQFNPDCVIRHAEGIDWHWLDEPGRDGRKTFCRHAYVMERRPYGCQKTGDKVGFDFPRHAGFYLVDLAYAYRRTRRDDMRARFVEWAEYHWQRRGPNGLLWMLTQHEPCCTFSLGVSLLDAVAILEDTDKDLADTWRERANRYIDSFLSVPHEPAAGYLSPGPDAPDQPRRPPTLLEPRWTGNAFGVSATIGLLCVAAYRHTRRDDLRTFALDMAGCYGKMGFPAGDPLPARDVALALLLFADAFELTGDLHWRRTAERWLVQVEKRFFDRPLVRAWTGLDYYESHLYPGLLLYAVARLISLFVSGFNRAVVPDYTRR
jgi:hypothetical protein